MEQYIKKSALVAEIENLENICKKYPTFNSYEEDLKEGRLLGYKDALHKLDTLEVKEVNLGKEIEDYFKGWSEDKDNGAACHYQYVDLQDCKAIAKHFFELGLKAQQ